VKMEAFVHGLFPGFWLFLVRSKKRFRGEYTPAFSESKPKMYIFTKRESRANERAKLPPCAPPSQTS
jgi:hypothetical protein